MIVRAMLKSQTNKAAWSCVESRNSVNKFDLLTLQDLEYLKLCCTAAVCRYVYGIPLKIFSSVFNQKRS